MRPRLTVALLPILAVTAAGCSEPMMRAVFRTEGATTVEAGNDPYRVGKEHFAAGRYAQANIAFRQALQKRPNDVGMLNALAASYDRMGRYDLADRHYEQALTLAPNDVQTLNNFGYSFLLRGRVREAAMLLEKAAAAAPQDEMVEANLQRLDQHRTQVARAGSEPAATPAAAKPLTRSGQGTYILDVAAVRFDGARISAPLPPPPQPDLAPVSQAAEAVEPPAPTPAPMIAVLRDEMLAAPPKPVLVAATKIAPPRLAPPQPAQPPQPSMAASSLSTTAPKTVVCHLEVSNGTGLPGMAGRARSWLGKQGVVAGCLSNLPQAATIERTTLLYMPRHRVAAERLGAMLPVKPDFAMRSDLTNEIVLVLGRDFDKQQEQGKRDAI